VTDNAVSKLTNLKILDLSFNHLISEKGVSKLQLESLESWSSLIAREKEQHPQNHILQV